MIVCLFRGHDWKAGIEFFGTGVGFLGRINQFTEETEAGYTCKRCGKEKWVKERCHSIKELKRRAKEAGWKRLDGVKL